MKKDGGDMRAAVAEIIESVYGDKDSHLVVPAILALFQKLVASKKNMPELMLSEYGKGQNDLVDDLLSEITK